MQNRITAPRRVLFLACALLAGLVLTPAALQAADQPAPAAAAAPAGNSATAPATDQHKLLFDVHSAAGLTCASCHTETPPSTPVAMPQCLTCHGSYDSLAAKTTNDDPNPHQSHLGPIPCSECHNVHKASQSVCASCHAFEFTVP